MTGRIKIFFDGGCRPNPGTMEIAVAAAGRTTILRNIGEGTNMDAEWLALIHAMKIALSLGTDDFVLMGDAAAVVKSVNGTVKSRAAAARHLEAFRAAAQGAAPRVRYVKRAQNLAGIALAALHQR